MTLENRISVWLKDTSKELNISNLGLKEWPHNLQGKEHLIVKLACLFNELKSLPNLPISLILIVLIVNSNHYPTFSILLNLIANLTN